MAKNADARTYLTIRCGPEMKEALERLASSDKRSLSNYVGLVLDKHIKEHKKSK